MERDEDFDDGGTPAWRSRQTYIRQQTLLRQPGLTGAWRRASPAKIFVIVFLISFGLPATVMVGGLLLAFSWSQLTGM